MYIFNADIVIMVSGMVSCYHGIQLYATLACMIDSDQCCMLSVVETYNVAIVDLGGAVEGV